MGPRCGGLLGRPHQVSQDGAWEASDTTRGGCEHGVYCNTNEPTQREAQSREGRLGAPQSGQAAQRELPAFSFLFLLHELSQTCSACFTKDPGLRVHTFHYFRRKHLQSASESSVSLVTLPAACPLHYKRKDKSSHCISWHPPPQTAQIN